VCRLSPERSPSGSASLEQAWPTFSSARFGVIPSFPETQDEPEHCPLSSGMPNRAFLICAALEPKNGKWPTLTPWTGHITEARFAVKDAGGQGAVASSVGPALMVAVHLRGWAQGVHVSAISLLIGPGMPACGAVPFRASRRRHGMGGNSARFVVPSRRVMVGAVRMRLLRMALAH
jgi:hypothetical protein